MGRSLEQRETADDALKAIKPQHSFVRCSPAQRGLVIVELQTYTVKHTAGWVGLLCIPGFVVISVSESAV